MAVPPKGTNPNITTCTASGPAQVGRISIEVPLAPPVCCYPVPALASALQMADSTGSRRTVRWWVWSLLAAAAILAVWLVGKVRLFDHLAYASDVFQNLALSRNVFRGHGLFWEPQYRGLIHNYVFPTAFFPLTAWLGAPGLFAGHALLLFGAVAAVLAPFRDAEPWRRDAAQVCVLALLLGPVGAYLWDDPIYGWHTELVFTPLAVLFAVELARPSRRAWLWAALLILNREEGAVIAWAVHVMVVAMRPSAAPVRVRLLRLAWLSVAYASVFAVGVGVLMARQPTVAESRIGGAIGRLVGAWGQPEIAREPSESRWPSLRCCSLRGAW